MQIEYIFRFDFGQEYNFVIDLDRHFNRKQDFSRLPVWTELKNHQCSNCPLAKEEYSHCPAAVDLDHILSNLAHAPATTQLMVRVLTPDREYQKHTTLEDGVRSLIGLVMATSACPVFRELKPNARTHLPFASRDELVLRLASLYLMKQYLQYRKGKDPDWELHGIIDQHEQLQRVNHAFWQRLMTAYQSDANSRALLSFFTASSDISRSLDAQLARMKTAFFGNTLI